MKIIIASNGKKTLKLSKSDWQNIGKKAGWIKVSHEDDPDLDDSDDSDDSVSEISGWCSTCGKKCHGKTVDNGIGSYEFWGSPGVHHDYGVASDCCEGELLENPPGKVKCLGCGKETHRVEIDDDEYASACCEASYEPIN